MKITKEQLPSKEQKKRGFQWFQKEEQAETPYDGKIKVRITEQEYNAIISACHMNNQGYRTFARTAIECFDKVDELIQPQTEENPQDWLTFMFDKEVKEPLIKAAKGAGLSLEEYIRALVWTRVKQVRKHDEEMEKKRVELRRKESLRSIHFNLSLTDELVERCESKFGRIESKTDIENKIKELFLKELA